MSTIINATTTNGVVIEPDNSGSLVLQTNSGTTALTISTAQDTTFAGKVTSAGDLILASNGTTTAITIDTSQRAAFVAGTAALPAITTTGDTNTGMWFPAADTIAFSEGGAEAMRISSSGQLLIGTTTTPSSGGLGILLTGTQGNNFWESRCNVTTNYGHMAYYNLNGFRGEIATNGTNLVFSNVSDYRLKENVVLMTNALDKVAQLKPCTYTWKSDGSNGQGFIAHELQAIVPDAVVGEKDAVDAEGNPKYQGVDTSFLVATLTAAIQEQQTIINDLKARIETLEAK